ncbi:peptidoglycan DD-metalloendopeptidase family protein [Plastorhodobacter daqingensis]|uniref:Peptidoglycan DD-metalloendopeptidase family protein n=1 Tax=Plastorhodobacter daqingensis TaxID=1387281 RepID=A0ABW2UF89_9RHOB
MVFQSPRFSLLLAGSALMVLTACNNNGQWTGPRDWDLRAGGGLNTSQAALQATLARPQPDARGVISYPTYQVAVARPGDTVASVAARIGLPAEDLARHNGLPTDMVLRQDEVLVLPRQVAGPAATTAPLPGSAAPEQIDITTLAGSAIDRAAGSSTPSAAAPPPVQPSGPEPVRHQVRRGETAYTIARSYNVTPRALAEWNGLGPDMMVREGQFLLIPVADQATRQAAAAAPAPVPAPGSGSATPVPPSAATPLPEPEATTPPPGPASPNMGAQRTAASGSARFAMPVQGQIIRGYEKRRNDGVDFGAPAGTTVHAADDGTVAAITRDTDQVPILVIRHSGNLMTVYANVDNIAVERNETVRRGQAIASVRAGTPSFLHFEVRDGFDSVDPMPYLQ